MAKNEALLTIEQLGAHGCGQDTNSACFALAKGPGGMQCAILSNPQLAQIAGIRLGWRVNIDPTDRLAWCPKGQLKNSKT